MVRTLCLCLLILGSWPLWAASQLSASVDKNPAMVGEAIVLEVTADARLSADQLNFRVLEQDFRITVPSVSQSTRVINGEASHSTSWRLSLFAREPGRYTIPAFEVGQVRSQPIELEVIAANAAADGKPDVFLTASLEQSRLHVQQTGYYTVTIHFRGDLQRGSLTEPSMEGASVLQIGRDEEGSKLIDGVRYRTISRRFAITPQRSGQFSITAPEFTGELLDRDSSRNNFFARTRTVLQHAETIAVDVLSIPADFPGDWLVAGLVTLHEEWSGDLTQLHQGEPITRTITLSGVDVAANQLPDIDFKAPAGLRLYPQQPERQGAQRNGRLVAQKTFTLAMIPTEAGEVHLPELRLPWWNSQRQMLDYATLPARTIQVLPAASAQSDATTSKLPTSGEAITPEQRPASPWHWNHVSSLLLAAWFISTTLLLWFWRRPKASQVSVAAPSFNATALKKACRHHQPEVARDCLLYWAQLQLDAQIRTLSALAATVSEPLRSELLLLNKALYHPAAETWQGDSLWQAWQSYQPDSVAQPVRSELKSLYS
ncbi:BatD family protein [Alkalimonas amylolytica]|uniref:Oxygen tolerance n=1 Tax=Alkalimonas amylolytica TaxID=152573 RepID=A0A1H4CA16_ALKAM|nr:BatD family protein [Alkalimonas amylolytica]SEA57224.1 Oxygen tolerance [Alkalimonas amylolytica]